MNDAVFSLSKHPAGDATVLAFDRFFYKGALHCFCSFSLLQTLFRLSSSEFVFHCVFLPSVEFHLKTKVTIFQQQVQYPEIVYFRKSGFFQHSTECPAATLALCWAGSGRRSRPRHSTEHPAATSALCWAGSGRRS